MGAYLTLDDYCEPGWGPVDLSDDPLSHRSFWAAILQFAAADGGVAIHYDLDAGDDCLSVEVDGSKYPMEPPASEARQMLLAAARRLAYGQGIRSLPRRLVALLPGRHYVGCISLYAPHLDIVWDVYSQSRSITIIRRNTG